MKAQGTDRLRLRARSASLDCGFGREAATGDFHFRELFPRELFRQEPDMAPPSTFFLNGPDTVETVIARCVESASSNAAASEPSGSAGTNMLAGTKHVVSRSRRWDFQTGSSFPGLTAGGIYFVTPLRMSENNTYEVYTVVERGDDKKPLWLRIGTGFVNKDRSLNIVLNAFPVDGMLQVRKGKNAK